MQAEKFIEYAVMAFASQKQYTINNWNINQMRKIALSMVIVITCLLFPQLVLADNTQRCLFISSYHVGYDWSDGIEFAVYEQLRGRCELRSVYLDSKRDAKVENIKKRASGIVQSIEEWNPHIIIAADDNASKFIIKPYYRNSHIPVIFCGINWSVEEYGYPYANTTGMVEVMPLKSLLSFVRQTVPNARNGVFLSANVVTEEKDFQRYKKVFASKGIKLRAELVTTFRDWSDKYHQSQSNDFIIVNNNAGITGWDTEKANKVVFKYGKIPSFTVYEWMMPYAMIGVTKVPSEQGEWAARAARSVLDGMSISDIPIIPNQRWNLWRNDELRKKFGLDIPMSIKIKSRQYK